MRAVLPGMLERRSGAIVNVASISGIIGGLPSRGTRGRSGPAYGAAKAGISALTLTAARALGRYGVRANAICPRARTAMTAEVFGAAPELGSGDVDPLSPEHVVTLVRFLASPAAKDVNGQVFVVYGPTVTLVAAPTVAHRFHSEDAMWDPSALSQSMSGYFAGRDPERNFGASITMED